MENQPSLFDEDSSKNTARSFADTWHGTSPRHAGWLRGLLAMPGIGPSTCLAIAKAFDSVDELLNSSALEVSRKAGKKVSSLEGLQFLEPTISENFYHIGYFENAYPPALRALKDAPPLIWVRGTLPKEQAITIVGTREPSKWGRNVAKVAGEIAARLNCDVISGLALGIDSAAHEGVLKHSGRTTAVLGSGIDFVTPQQNRILADAILESGGCLISEVEPGTRPSAITLVSRNRLQAALGRSLLMVECGIPSGTLHTVRFAFALNKPIGVPRPPIAHGDGNQDGNAALIDNHGMTGDILGANGWLRAQIEARAPFATAIEDIDELEQFIRSS